MASTRHQIQVRLLQEWVKLSLLRPDEVPVEDAPVSQPEGAERAQPPPFPPPPATVSTESTGETAASPPLPAGREELEPPREGTVRHRWSQGSVDLDAGRDFEAYVTEALNDLQIEGSLEQAPDCREGTCKVSLYFDNGDEAGRFQAAASTGAQTELDFKSFKNGVSVDVYVVRE